MASDICSEDKCNITLPVKNSTKYEAEFFIEVLYSSFEKPDDVVIKVPGLEYENAEETSRVFTSNQLQVINIVLQNTVKSIGSMQCYHIQHI